MSFEIEPLRAVSIARTDGFLTDGFEQHNRKTRTSLTRLKTGRNLDTFSSFRLQLSRFASSRSDGYVLSCLATGQADVANTKMQDTNTPIDDERHRPTTTRMRGVVAT